jgi:PAS domain-containing protein
MPVIGGPHDGRELDVDLPVVWLPKPPQAAWLSESPEPPAPEEPETYVAVRLRPGCGPARVLLHESLYRRFQRYSTHGGEVSDLAAVAKQICDWIVQPGIPLDARQRAVAELEVDFRIAQLEALPFDLPDPRILQVEPVLAAERWWCGDEECDCTQARIVTWNEQLAADLGWPRERLQLREVWRGPFHTDGHGDAFAELELARQYLELVAPTLLARIQWLRA